VSALQHWAPDLAPAPGTPALVAAVGWDLAKRKEPALLLALWLASAQSWATATVTRTEAVLDSEVEVPGHFGLAEIPGESNEAVQHGARRAGLHRDQNSAPLE
jgi:hypothetical protein